MRTWQRRQRRRVWKGSQLTQRETGADKGEREALQAAWLPVLQLRRAAAAAGLRLQLARSWGQRNGPAERRANGST